MQTGRESTYDTASLDYRPVSHGYADAMGGARGYHHHQRAPSLTYGAEKRRGSLGYRRPSQGEGGLLERRTSYGQMQQQQQQARPQSQHQQLQLLGHGSAQENRKSMQVHVGVAEDDDDAAYGGFTEQNTARRESHGQAQAQGVREGYASGNRVPVARVRTREREREAQREREYAY